MYLFISARCRSRGIKALSAICIYLMIRDLWSGDGWIVCETPFWLWAPLLKRFP